MHALARTKIDTHHHIVPDFYRDWLAGKGIDSGGMPIPTWSVRGSSRIMDRLGVRTAILSVSTPGVEPAEGAEAVSLARDLNDASAKVVQSHPGRFGFFATLPQQDVPASIEEVGRAYGELRADGVALLTNSRGTYLGDPSLEPLMRELDARRAVVFVHPSHLPAAGVAGVPAYAADFLLDTVRAALSLGRHGVLDRYPRIRFILSHGGGFLPFAAFRLSTSISPQGEVRDGLRLLRRFYYDTALASTPFSMPSLLRAVPPSHILFGSDFPYAPEYASVAFTRVLDAYPLLGRHHAINHANAQRLFPRLGVRGAPVASH